jgi:hypothetical protein
MSDDLKNLREIAAKNEELLLSFNDIHKLIINDCASMINKHFIEIANTAKLSHVVQDTSREVNDVIKKIAVCQDKQSVLISRLETNFYDNLIENFIPEFSEKVVNKLILNEFNKFEIKLDDVLKSSDILIEKSTDLQNNYIKNKDDICSSVGAIIDIINNTKDEFEKDYEKLKIDFRSASNSHQNNLIKYQKDINTLLKAEFKKINILKTISIVSSSTFVGMTLMYFLFQFLH